MQELYPDVKIIKDIGSEFNSKRKEFKSIPDQVIKGDCIHL